MILDSGYTSQNITDSETAKRAAEREANRVFPADRSHSDLKTKQYHSPKLTTAVPIGEVTMGSLAAEVSLHCIICIEEFDVKDRPPVVLPCGHTYVCIICAKRLRKCMECREPLYWTPPVSVKAPPVPNPNFRTPISRYAPRDRRYGAAPSTPTHPAMAAPVKEEPVPLPLPKNTVLIGVIEAAERQSRLLKLAKAEDGRSKSPYGDEDEESVEVEADGIDSSKLDPLLAGMSAFVGTCGTYAVREPLGLAVLPFDPNKRHHDSSPDDDLDLSGEEKKIDFAKEPFTIEEGQTVQVVGVDEGVYKLARGAGYIVASVNQLAKVGAPLETSCKYEGMLQSVERKRRELERELSEINYLVHGLAERIDVEQQNEPEYPVITERKPPPEDVGDDENDVASTPQTPVTPPGHDSPGDPQSTSSTEVNLGNPRTPAHQISRDRAVYSPPKSCPMPGTIPGFHGTALTHGLVQPFMDGEPAGLPRYRITNDDDLHAAQWSFGCGTGLFGERLLEQDCDSANVMALSFDDSLVDGPRSRGAGAQSRTLAARTIASTGFGQGEGLLRSGGSFDGPINFRTGMSGHTGLNLSRKKSSPMSRPHQVRMMSEHRGIAAGGGRTHGGGGPDLQRRNLNMPSIPK